MALKSKKNTGLKGYVEGGLVDPQDPLVKKTTPKPPVVKVVPATAYNPEVFSAELAKKKKIGLNKEGNIPLSGDFGMQVNALTTGVKTTQDYLFDYMKANKKDGLTSAEADALLKKANMGSYDDYISKAKNLKAYRDLTVVPAKPLEQSVDIGITTQNAGQGGGYTMEPTTPFDSTHYEYLFPKNTYKPSVQKKAKGGEVNGKGIKGYIQGGDIQEQSVRTASARGFSNKPIDYVEDFVVGNADIALNGLGLENVIKDKDYKTKTGSKFNAASRGIGTVGRSVTGGVVNYFIPGLGTGINAGLNMGTKATGEDEGIDPKYRAQQDKASSTIGVASNLVSGMGKNKMNKGSEASEEESTIDENGIDTTTGEIAVTDTATTNKPSQANQNREWSTFNTGEFGGNTKALAAWNAASGGTGETKQSIINAYYNGEYGMANGGKIVGKGTGTSDSIPAKLQDDGFVVPAVNAKIAEELRSKYLGDSKSKIASLQKGGVPVKVSNGEHYFTKAEKAILEANGVDLNKLAPNAESTKPSGGLAGYVDGGAIDDKKKKKLSEEDQLLADAEAKIKNQKESKAKSDKSKSESDAQKAIIEKNASILSKNRVQRANKKDEFRNELIEVEKKSLAHTNAYKNYLAVKANPKSTAQEIYNAKEKVVLSSGEKFPTGKAGSVSDLAVKEAYVAGAKKLKGEVGRVLKEKSFYDDDKNFDPITHRQIKENSTSSSSSVSPISKVAGVGDAGKTWSAVAEKVKSEQKAQGATQSTPLAKSSPAKNTRKGIAGVGMDKIKIDTTPRETTDAEFAQQSADLQTAEDKRIASLSPTSQQVAQTPAEKQLEQSALDGVGTGVVPVTTKEKNNPFKQMDIGKGIALAQTGLGLQQLLQDGERPVDSLDKDFVQTVDEAKADSQFGFTPLQMQIANRGIEKNRAADEQTIINLSGGSAGTALANIRAAGIAANDAKNNLTAQSEQLRLQKKRYADSQVANKANMSKQLFNEKLNAFNVDQQAGSELLGAGIRNVIGSSRLDRELEAQNKREGMYNPTFNIA